MRMKMIDDAEEDGDDNGDEVDDDGDDGVCRQTGLQYPSSRGNSKR